MDDDAIVPAGPGLRHVVGMLAMRPFGPYLAAHFLAGLAIWINRIAVGWVAWQLTESATWLGIIAFVRLGPALIGAPLGGVFADRLFRPTILRTTRSLSCVLNLALCGLMALDLVRIEALVLIVAVDGFMDAFGNASSKALVYDLVPRAVLSSAIPLNSLAFNTAGLAGPAAAGAIIAFVGTPFAFAAAALCLAAFVVFLTVIAGSLSFRKSDFASRSISADLVDTVRYARAHPTIGPLLLLHFAFALTIRPLTELLPGFAAQVFNGDAVTLATLNATIGGAAILGGLWMASRGSSEGLTTLTMAAACVIGLATLAFVSTTELVVAVLALAVFGFCRIVRVAGTQALVQLAVAGRQRGKVLSLYGVILRLGGALGALFLGMLADVIGLRPAVAVAAVMAIGCWFLVLRKRHAIDQGISRDQDQGEGEREQHGVI